jgi:hypothetical protein
MIDWIGSLRIREHSSGRVVLGLSRSTAVAGLVIAIAGALIALRLWPISMWLAAIPLIIAGLGVLLATLQRDVVIDRAAGVLRVDQRAFGLGNHSVVPLFHLRAVVVMARGDDSEDAPARLLPTSSRYVAYLDRRVGDAIYLDESRKCAGLLRLAEVIADVAELRLEYEAVPPTMAG